MEFPEKQYKIIQQFCLGFLLKLNKKYSDPELIRKYNSTKDDFINSSPVWNSILEELTKCDNTDEYCSKVQYLIYHCIICLTDSKNEVWQKYFDIVNKLELVPIYPTLGHLKLMITFFQKIQEKVEEKVNYFENEKNRLYFIKNELICDFNLFQLHYLHTVFGLEKFNLSNHTEMYPVNPIEYVWQYQPININNQKMKLKLDTVLHSIPTTQQFRTDYITLAIEKLIHKDYLEGRTDNISISDYQLRDLIYIMGKLSYNPDERFNKFLHTLDVQQVCFIEQ